MLAQFVVVLFVLFTTSAVVRPSCSCSLFQNGRLLSHISTAQYCSAMLRYVYCLYIRNYFCLEWRECPSTNLTHYLRYSSTKSIIILISLALDNIVEDALLPFKLHCDPRCPIRLSSGIMQREQLPSGCYGYVTYNDDF